MSYKKIAVVVLLIAVTTSAAAQDGMSVRLKDIAYFQGVRENQLVGFGLITGLEGNGDSSNSTLLRSVLSNLLASFSISISTDEIQSRNAAVVMVTADVPSFVRPGDRISVYVSSIGDATSLTNGILLQTPLKASNGNTYAVAQGQVSSSEEGGRTVGIIPGGALVEREVLSTYLEDGSVSILVRNPDFTTTSRIADLLRETYPEQQVVAVDASLVQISLPEQTDPVAFVAGIEELQIIPDRPARVVVNPRTGVVVVGENVKIGQVMVSYRGTKIEIGARPSRSSSSQGENLLLIPEIPTVRDLLDVLQEAGLDADTIIEILKAIERAGALYGRLVVM